jgi:two-component system, OmpR family, sensor histidine kinase BaeS
MSFRLRVLALVSLVAVTAVGVTAYLAFAQASRQVSESAEADGQTVERIVDGLEAYARRHGTWEGVPQTVAGLAAQTGQRIKLVTGSGTVVVDTDTLAGRVARPVTNPVTLVDPRPSLILPPDLTQHGVRPWDATLDAIRRYRDGVRFAACLTRQGIGVTDSPGEYGVPVYAPDRDAAERFPAQVAQCRVAAPAGASTPADMEEVLACRGKRPASAEAHTVPDAVAEMRDCLHRVFAVRTGDVAPVPLQVYLGTTGETRTRLQPGPVIALAVLMAMLAVAVTAALSRRVLRPIATLTAAAKRVGDGDLSLHVPDTGRDELAELARSFNRMADSLRRGEERQRRLVADVAHELRTPLANLRGYLEALADGVLPPSPELFASLHEEAVLQQRIVDDLQDLALAEAGALAYHRTSTDLAELLETCRTAQQAVADAAGVALHVRADGPVFVWADPDRLRQVIGNLVSNALRATPAGGAVSLAAPAPVDGWARLVVRDTGVGIAPEHLPHVFDRFWRADTARGRNTGGSGLGLAIAKQIVTDHGGRTTAASAPDEGTSVEIVLPVHGRAT